jgi:hypothetical protein
MQIPLWYPVMARVRIAQRCLGFTTCCARSRIALWRWSRPNSKLVRSCRPNRPLSSIHCGAAVMSRERISPAWCWPEWVLLPPDLENEIRRNRLFGAARASKPSARQVRSGPYERRPDTAVHRCYSFRMTSGLAHAANRCDIAHVPIAPTCRMPSDPLVTQGIARPFALKVGIRRA